MKNKLIYQAIIVYLCFLMLLFGNNEMVSAKTKKKSTVTPTPITNPQDSAIRAAKAALARQINIPVDQINLVSIQAATWRDACLGIYDPDRMCAQEITPGYRIILAAQGKNYIFRTNKTGSIVRLES